MSDMILNFEDQPVRVVFDADGTRWWVAKDVCACLGLARVDSSLRRLDDDEKGAHQVSTLGGRQAMQVVNEAGLFRLCASSITAAARRFQRWIFHEVLPALMQTGTYTMPGAVPANNDDNAFEIPMDIDHWLSMVREARRTFGRAAAARVWALSPLPQVAGGNEMAERHTHLGLNCAAFVTACCDVTGDPRDFVSSRHLSVVAFDFYRKNGWPMPGRRSFSNLLRATLTGPDAIVPPGMVSAAKVSDTGYRGLILLPDHD